MQRVSYHRIWILKGFFCKSPFPTFAEKDAQIVVMIFIYWNMTVFVYHALLLWSGCCIVSTLEDDTDADLTAGENIGASTLEDVTDAHLTAVGINDTQIVSTTKFLLLTNVPHLRDSHCSTAECRFLHSSRHSLSGCQSMTSE